MLLENEALPERLTGDTFREIMSGVLNVGQTVDGSVAITSTRDQMEVRLSPSKVDVRDLSGQPKRVPKEIPRVITKVWDLLQDPVMKSYGINFVLEVPMAEPKVWLGDRFLATSLKSELDDLSSDQISISFEQKIKTQTIRFQAVRDSRININSNASQTAESLPALEQLQDELAAQYEALIALLDKFGVKSQ